MRPSLIFHALAQAVLHIFSIDVVSFSLCPEQAACRPTGLRVEVLLQVLVFQRFIPWWMIVFDIYTVKLIPGQVSSVTVHFLKCWLDTYGMPPLPFKTFLNPKKNTTCRRASADETRVIYLMCPCHRSNSNFQHCTRSTMEILVVQLVPVKLPSERSERRIFWT